MSLSSEGAGGDPVPSGGRIEGRESTLQTLFEGAPRLMNEAIDLLGELRAVVNNDNRQAVGDLLNNLATSSARLDGVLKDLQNLATPLGNAATEIAGFTDRLGALSDTADTTLTTATSALESAGKAADAAVGTLDTARTTFDSADTLIRGDLAQFVQRGASVASMLDDTLSTLDPSIRATLEAAQQLMDTQLPQLVADLQAAANMAEQQIALVGSDASTLIARYEQVGQSVQDRADQTAVVIKNFDRTLDEALATLESFRRTSEAANTFLQEEGRPLAQQTTSAMASVEELTGTTLPPLVNQTTTTMATLDREVTAFSASGREMLGTLQQRLVEAKTTLEEIDSAMVASGRAADSVWKSSEEFYDLIDGDTAAVMAEARSALETINTSIDQDLPAILSSVRDATETANSVIAALGDDLSGLDGLVSSGTSALDTVNKTFQNANTTLASINGAMGAAEDALRTAETTFDQVNVILDKDISAMVTDIRGAVTSFASAIDTVSGEVTAISGRLLDASDSAAGLIGTVDQVVQANQRQLSDFLRVGLPQFQVFLLESRRLVVNLERLVDRIESDPARFILGTQAPEFRR
ncbi:MAG: hypothetical protein HRU31_00340 [Rhodobacteraceae bacterium]|nr:hypothetical protein [Paracoccaceae bacterium]